ncbi:MAG: PEGA domain-containing protein [Gammaproteobacteria bacterium]|nr:MAG: PEGA domain-containing protein [Gammaproteobacteria bacterium]
MYKRLLLVFTPLLASGCATITRGTTEAFVVKSDPSGAQVHLSTGETCTTPCTLRKKRKDSFVVHISKPGYQPVEVQVVNEVSGGGAAGMAGNVIFGGLIGAAVDAGSGAMLHLVPNPVDVKLEPIDRAQGENGTQTD